jgi:hypothetical protein
MAELPPSFSDEYQPVRLLERSGGLVAYAVRGPRGSLWLCESEEQAREFADEMNVFPKSWPSAEQWPGQAFGK